MTERIKVVRNLITTSEININFVRLQKFKVGDMLHGVFAHPGKDGKQHPGTGKVIEITDPSGMQALAKCTQPGCKVVVEVVAVAPKTEE